MTDESPQRLLADTVYKHLRAIAGIQLRNERRDHTLSATALVHEAYLRLPPESSEADRALFLHGAAESMRHILIDHARRRGAAKRGKGWKRSIESVEQLAEEADETDIVALDGAFVRLEADDPRAAAVVRLRFYAGLGVDKTAEILGISRRSVLRDWEYARVFLLAALGESGEVEGQH
jgi:RNA polymerase sigma factor (TIGR02999 family)